MRFNTKKVISLLMIFFMVIGLTACNDIIIIPDITPSISDNPGNIEPPSTSGNPENVVVPDNKVVDGDLQIHFVDVGQADCIVITNKDEAMIIDGGNNDDGDIVKKYLKKIGVNEFKYAIGTHPHEDHIGAFDVVINNYDIETIIMPNKFSTTKTFEDVITAIENKKMQITEAKVGDKYVLGDAEFVILAPNKDYDEVNDASVVIRLTYGENSFMLTGDAESTSEKDILKTGLTLKSDVLKFGHHGSSTSTSIEFLEAVSPKYGVIMCEVGNSYGHPHKETLTKIKNYGIEVYRTDEDGSIVLTSDGKNITWKTEKNNTSSNEEVEEKNETYVLNTNSKKFHYPTCSGVEKISDKNREVFSGSREELISNGYSACGICKP